MKKGKTLKGTDPLAVDFTDASFWSGSFYADNALNLLHERFDELLLERKHEFEAMKTMTERAESNLRSTGPRL